MRRITIAIPSLLLTACGVEKISGDEGGGCVPEPVQAVFDARCAAMPGCHGDSPTPTVSLDLRPGGSSNIVGQMSSQIPSLPLVELGNIDGSYLALKMAAMPAMPITGLRMPQAANFADSALQADLSIVVGWIGGADFSTCVGGSETAADTSGESSSSGGVEVKFCGLVDLAPGIPSPVVSGDAAGVIPTEIGTILDNNCGCHFSDGPFVRPVGDAADTAPPHMTTLEDWHAMSSPTGTMTTLLDVRSRLEPSIPQLIMPPPASCDIGTGQMPAETMPPDERARLIEWIDADGPDGASWP